MATGNRTLKLSILADVDELKKSLGTATQEVEGFGDKVGNFSKKAALAFAAVGAAVSAFAVSSVKAAAADEKGRKTLEQTIRTNTKATEDQIKSIDKYITKQSIATATTDDELRPALARLIRSTNDVAKAQDLLTLSQEIATATGKPLEAVANALGKSFDGQNTALGKLGLGIDAATLKTGSHEEIMKQLKGTYKGFIENEAETAEFKFKQISIATQEAKESIGAALLPIVKQLADFLIITVVPNINAFVDGLTKVKVEGKDAGNNAYQFGLQVRGIVDWLIAAKDELITIGQLIGFVFVASKIYTYITALLELVAAFKAIQAAASLAAVASAFATGGGSIVAGTVALAGAGIAAGVANTAINGTNTAQSMNTTSATAAQLASGAARAGTTVNNITVKAVDSEGASRAVAKVINQSSARSIPALSGSSVRGN
jgi:hypothetical protein